MNGYLKALACVLLFSTVCTGASAGSFDFLVYGRTQAAAVRLADGRVLIVGGFNGSESDASAELYDPATRTFSPIGARLNVARYGHTATLLPDGRVLIYGGFTEGGVSPGPELFDVSKSAFTALPAPESVTRGYHTAITSPSDGSVWIVGGEDYGLRPVRTILRFMPKQGTFTEEKR